MRTQIMRLIIAAMALIGKRYCLFTVFLICMYLRESNVHFMVHFRDSQFLHSAFVLPSFLTWNPAPTKMTSRWSWPRLFFWTMSSWSIDRQGLLQRWFRFSMCFTIIFLVNLTACSELFSRRWFVAGFLYHKKLSWILWYYWHHNNLGFLIYGLIL